MVRAQPDRDRGDHRPHPAHPRARREPPDHRARDARDHGAVAPPGGAASRREDRRRRRPTSWRATAGDRGLPGRGDAEAHEPARAARRRRGLRRSAALRGVDLVVEAGEILVGGRRQRRGQDDHAAHHLGLLRPRAGEILARGPAASTGCRATRWSSAAWCRCRRAARSFRASPCSRTSSSAPTTRGAPSSGAESLERVFALFPRARASAAGQAAGTLSGRRAADARHRARPDGAAASILMLDEPSLGLAPLIVQEIFSIDQPRSTSAGTTVLLVEQNTRQALARSRARLRAREWARGAGRLGRGAARQRVRAPGAILACEPPKRGVRRRGDGDRA